MADAFTKDERARTDGNSLLILLRFLAQLRLFCILVLPATGFALISSIAMQLFLWLSGEITRCPQVVGCVVTVPFINAAFSLSIALIGALIGTAFLIRVMGWMLFEIGGQISALSMFRRLIEALSRVRTTFFDEQPSGRIINRVVRDFDQLRTMGPIRVGDTLNALMDLIVIAAVLSLAHPLAGLIVVPTVIVFFYIQRNIAPMLQHMLVHRSMRFGEMLHRQTDAIEGIRTFLLYGSDRMLFLRLQRAAERFVQAHLLRAAIEAWGRFWSRTAAAVSSFVGLVGTAVAHHDGYISTVLAAVMVTALFRLSGVFEWLTWTIGYLLESTGHARRIFEYVDMPTEESEEGTHGRSFVKSGTARRITGGDLTFHDYSMSYRADTPTILHGITTTIAAGAHIGIVGRTGAGKSSVVQALYRMVRLQNGDISIGGTSLFSLPIDDARALFTVVPQEPYLFSGTIRSNIDPLGLVNDEALKAALQRVELQVTLDSLVAEGGKNFSLGERQLLALARALVSTAPVVIMDEPTSSVDTLTDQRIQRVIREELRERTIITIAHRLETLNHVDRIIDFADGRIVREGTPAEVLPGLNQGALG